MPYIPCGDFLLRCFLGHFLWPDHEPLRLAHKRQLVILVCKHTGDCWEFLVLRSHMCIVACVFIVGSTPYGVLIRARLSQRIASHAILYLAALPGGDAGYSLTFLF